MSAHKQPKQSVLHKEHKHPSCHSCSHSRSDRDKQSAAISPGPMHDLWRVPFIVHLIDSNSDSHACGFHCSPEDRDSLCCSSHAREHSRIGTSHILHWASHKPSRVESPVPSRVCYTPTLGLSLSSSTISACARFCWSCVLFEIVRRRWKISTRCRRPTRVQPRHSAIGALLVRECFSFRSP